MPTLVVEAVPVVFILQVIPASHQVPPRCMLLPILVEGAAPADITALENLV